MSFPNIDYSLQYYNDDYPYNQSPNYYPFDDSFSLNLSRENHLKYGDISEMQLLNNSNNKNINIEGDKECSPAPAPLRASSNINQPNNQNQNELSNSNMECPEVVNKTINTNELDDKAKEIFKLLCDNENFNIYDDNELIEKPFDKTRYFIENDILSQSLGNTDPNINFDLENKSAAVNVIPINDNLNSPPNKICNSENNVNILNSNELYVPKNNSIITPFCSKVLFINTNEGKKTKNKNGYIRKLKPDSLRKKIKSRFHKKLKQIINIKLKECGSKLLFDLFPQSFTTNINIEFNRPLLNITMRELFQKKFGFKAKDREKIDFNIKVIKYIEETPHLNNDEKISKFLDSTYEEIIQSYMHGQYLLEDIEKLKKEGENSDYINRYVFIAIHWIDFYKNGGIKI